MNQTHYTIHGINGPVVKVTGGKGLAMMDMVSVGEEGLIGEVVSVDRSATTVQVYEDTAGFKPSQPVVTRGPPGHHPVWHADQHLRQHAPQGHWAESGPFIGRGLNIPSLDQEKTWDVTLHVKAGDVLAPGALYASCPETPLIVHRCLVPAGVSGRVTKVAPAGAYRVSDTLVELTDDHGQIHPLALAQRWPIRTPRPIAQRLPIDRPLVTGQRIIDTLFPIGKGGAAAIPGPFGAGKTMTQHQLAKWSDADIIVYLGCGERGNEMTQALEEFSELLDPKSQQPLMNRTILIANTSNMPVAAREASVYTGMTIAEYYRDMGYHVALMADSTSRWAEALREISGRLEEMPAEEGFPAYLASRLAEFYERAGYVKTLEGKEGSVTVIGAVSPQGGDFSEPVTQNTKRYVRTFWVQDRALAYARHIPSINWLTSYSEYLGDLGGWYYDNVGHDFMSLP
ncbi:MAG: V-type ATP synthase subunit A [Flavonifractor plautii]